MTDEPATDSRGYHRAGLEDERGGDLRGRVAAARERAGVLARQLGGSTVNVAAGADEDAFFTDAAGDPTLVSRYDLERTVPAAKKGHLTEVERYWVNKPYAFVVILRSEKENELKYHVVEPYLTEVEAAVREFLTDKLADAIKYSREAGRRDESVAARAQVIEEEALDLLARYDLYRSQQRDRSLLGTVLSAIRTTADRSVRDTTATPGIYPSATAVRGGEQDIRPEPAVNDEAVEELTVAEVERLLYYLKRDFVGYGPIDPIKHDINVEDISCDGYDTPVFAYHTDHEQLITNVEYDPEKLDDFVVKLAQRSGKSISKRQPQVDVTLPDGSRAQLTLGTAVSDRGTNFTIRQFKDVPFTPVDLINWNTFSLDEMAFLWLCIENHMSLIFAGGTASGKTTSLNAVSLFIPSKAKIVSIEDTREVELPQRNWIASVTRPSFGEEDAGDVDEFDLLEAALRQRPDYIVMGEVRGEEGRTLFQVMSTGHTTYTTFHADSVGEVLKRFTTEPINVSKTMFTALDLVSIQTQTRVQGRKVRRARTITEIQEYDAEADEITVQDVYEWDADTDTFTRDNDSSALEQIAFDRGWDTDRLRRELFERRVVLAYLIENGLNTYAEVAATVQGYMNDPDTILGLMADGRLADSLADLRAMETVFIDVDEAKEAMVPRPDPTEATAQTATTVLDRAQSNLFDAFEPAADRQLEAALPGAEAAATDPSVGGAPASAEIVADGYDWNTQGGSTGFDDVPERTGETSAPDAGAGLGGAEPDDEATAERGGEVEPIDEDGAVLDDELLSSGGEGEIVAEETAPGDGRQSDRSEESEGGD